MEHTRQHFGTKSRRKRRRRLVSGNTHKETRELNYLAGNQDGGRRGALPCKP